MLHRLTYASLLAVSLLPFAAASAADAPDESEQAARQKLEDARERLEQAAREVAELSAHMAGAHLPELAMHLRVNPNRAMLGIALDGEDAGDDGVRVLSVSPGGPAADAGLKAGDVIVELNGKALKGDKSERPNAKLFAGMAKLKPGDEATLRYRRDGKSASAKVKVAALPARVMQFERRLGDGEQGPMTMMLRDMHAAHGGPFGQLELVTLTPKLGQYFGADKGLLIVRLPERADLKLEEGDVLLDIDGRAPADPGHAFRILNSYQPGEKVTLNVLRQRKKIAVRLTVPEGRMRGRSDASAAPMPPPPPLPPAKSL